MDESSNRVIPKVMIDLRCLQDPDYALRGIGRQARAILMHRPATCGPIAGLIDPLLPMPEAGIIERLDLVRPNGYFPQAGPGTVFLNPSPMTADPRFTARLMGNADITKIALVHDFIPFDDAPHYLPHAAQRLRYFTALAWLRKYDSYLANSAATQARLHQLAGAVQSEVTGVALPGWVFAGGKGTASHILAVAGDDARKNPEIVIQAHASSNILQARRVGLIITGNISLASWGKFQALAQAAGGDPNLLANPGHVSDAQLAGLYRNAICVVSPSRAEGFSLPVIEAMAAGAPSVASDIPAHAELVTDAQLRFHPDDPQHLRAILERIVRDTEYRTGIIAAQAKIWPEYAAEKVAAKIWSAVLRGRNPRRLNIGGRKPRIAMLSPFPPARTGIADFSSACAQALSAHVDLSLFSAAEKPDPVAGLQVAPLSALPHLAKQVDRIISVLGNSRFHNGIYDLLTRYGGAAICHDSRLLHFHLDRYGSQSTALLATQELARDVSESELEDWVRDETRREATLLGEAARHAQPLIFHAQASAAWVQHQFKSDARYLPFAVQRSWTESVLDPAAKTAAKLRLGLDPLQIHIASFGFLQPDKGIDVMLRALQHLVQLGFNAHLHWVGEANAAAREILDQANATGLAGKFSQATGFLSEAQFRDYFLAADIGLQLRNSGAGSISGALQDCVTAGLPSVANECLAAALETPDYVIRVSDALDAMEIAGALAGLIETPPVDLRAQWAEYCASRSISNYAAKLCEILEI